MKITSVEDLIKFIEENKENITIEKDSWEGVHFKIKNKALKDEPYLKELIITENKAYNKNYGDNRICECGHPYHRHFDSHEDNYACGCKYCTCYDFKEKENN